MAEVRDFAPDRQWLSASEVLAAVFAVLFVVAGALALDGIGGSIDVGDTTGEGVDYGPLPLDQGAAGYGAGGEENGGAGGAGAGAGGTGTIPTGLFFGIPL